ncbi:MAG TPA: hypothetical protein VK901_00530 [Nitrospiraceae bacterium]|nr:hypothetical protein [Nitrospiraceae bacterium]
MPFSIQARDLPNKGIHMTARKWGESFLKSGLPLEHLTQVTLRDMGWSCTAQPEFKRLNRESVETWFELDLMAESPNKNLDTSLLFIIECKYHDTNRHWFFLPLSSPGRWQFDERVLNCGPFQTLLKPKDSSLLKSAPLSSGGIVVSEDGKKQENAVYTAIQQLANGFVPCALSWMFSYNINFRISENELSFIPNATALIPVIVTNAKLYRLRESVTDLDTIRSASTPADIADDLEWTWYYHDPSRALFDQNRDAILAHRKTDPQLIYRFPFVNERMSEFKSRPNWIAVINIKALAKATADIQKQFLAMDTQSIDAFIRRPKKSRQRRPSRHQPS